MVRMVMGIIKIYLLGNWLANVLFDITNICIKIAYDVVYNKTNLLPH